MRHITTFGLVTLAVGALAAGCGDDDDGRLLGTSGNGGAAGTGNTGGAGGTAGVGAGGGGRGGMGGGTAVPASCAQCVELSVPLTPTSASRQAQFLFRPAALADMSNTTITWRVKVVTPTTEIPGDAMYVAPFAQNGEPLGYAGAYDPQTALNAANGFTSADTWVEIEQDIAGFGVTPPGGADAGDAGDGVVDAGAEGDAGAVAGGFDKTQVFQFGLYVGATAAFTGTGTVRVALDSVTFSDPAFTDVTFTAGVEGFQLDAYMMPPGSTLVFRP